MSSATLDRQAGSFPGTLPRGVFANARIDLIGAGNIGAFVAATLAEAGCGFLRLIDRDRVELRNIVNQLYTTDDVGRPKAEALADHVRRISPRTEVETHVADLKDVPHGLFADVDFCLAGLDSLDARQATNERAWPQGVLVIDGAVDGDGEPIGSVEVLVPGDATACLECRWGAEHYRQLAREMPCNPKAGAAGPPTGASALLGASVASLMVFEAARMRSGSHAECSHLLEFDLRYEGIRKSRLRRAAGCRFDHAVVRQRIELGVAFAAATIGDVLRAVDRAAIDHKAATGGRGEAPTAQLHFRRRIFDAGLFGGNRWLNREQLAPYATCRLAELGLTRHDRIRVKANGLDAFVNLDDLT